MFELMFVFLFVAFMIVFLMFSKKILAHFEKTSELKQKELIALVRIDDQLDKLNHNVSLECELLRGVDNG